jgi:hypothetical protein
LAWQIEFGREGKRDFAKLDKPVQRRNFEYRNERIAVADDARNFGPQFWPAVLVRRFVTASQDCGATV